MNNLTRNIENLLLVEKIEQEKYSFYVLKTVSWAESRGPNLWFSGHEVKRFVIISGKRFKVSSDLDIFLLDNLKSSNSLELAFAYKEAGQILQKNYSLIPHPSLTNWWILEVAQNHLETLINDFCHTVSLSHQNGEIFKKACSRLFFSNITP